MAIVPWDDPVNYGAHVPCAVSTYGTLRKVGAVRHARDGDAGRAREGGFPASVVNRPPVKAQAIQQRAGDGDAVSCVVMSCRVAVPGGPARYAGPRWCSPSTMVFVHRCFTGAKLLHCCSTPNGQRHIRSSATWIRRPAVSRLTVIDRRHVLSRHSQHDMPCRGNVKMPEFTEHKRSLLGAPACPSYDAYHDALLVRIAWAT